MERLENPQGRWKAAVLIGLVVAAMVFWQWAGSDGPAPPRSEVLPTAQSSDSAGGSTFAKAASGHREVVVGPVPPQERVGSAPVVPTTWTVRARVVDETYQPVPFASVSLRPLWRSSRAQAGASPEALLLTADATGRVSRTLRCDAVGLAAKAAGFANKPTVGVSRKSPDNEVVLLLTRPVRIRGQVCQADGAPVADAQVLCDVGGIRNRPEPVQRKKYVTAADGTFEATVRLGGRYTFTATKAGKSTFSVEALIDSRSPSEVALVMRGGITVSGMVRDPDGQLAVDGVVYAWRDGLGGSLLRVNTFGGKYTLELSGFCEFQLSAHGHGCASGTPIVIAPTPANPHLKVDLTCQQLGEIRGRVFGADGSPRKGQEVVAWSGGLHRSSMSRPEDARFRNVRPVRSADDGTFVFAVHPEAEWAVAAKASGVDGVERAEAFGLRAGGPEVQLVLAAPTCCIRGRVERVDGRPIGGIRAQVWRVLGEAMSGSLDFPVVLDERGWFELPPRASGERLVVVVMPDDPSMAPQSVGPFDTGDEAVDLRFRLGPVGELPVEVVDADGNAVPFAKVRLEIPYGHSLMRSNATDQFGRALLKRCVPGSATLSVRLWNRVVLERDIEVGPGPNRTMFVQLDR